MFDYGDVWVDDWSDMRQFGPSARHLRNIVLALLRDLQFATVLDVGCGEGSLLNDLYGVQPALQPFGVDLSESALARARQRMPGGEFASLDVANARLQRQFDLVVCTDVVEHIPDDRAALGNLAGMTGRYLVVSSLQGRMRGFEATVGHVRNYKPGELAAKIEATGLRVVRVVQWGFPFFSPLYRNLLDRVGGRGTTGQYGWFRRMIAGALYQLFRLNAWTRGDVIVVLAERPRA